MSLRQPNLKMSKSHPDPRSRILITDSPEDIRAKIMAAMTDSVPGISYDRENRPGLANLIEIISHFEKDGKSCVDIAHEHEPLSIREFKGKVIDCLLSNLSKIRTEYERLLAAENNIYLDEVAMKGANQARANAEATMAILRKAIGLV